ncbi:MAG TPA: hypothetical protein VI461_01805, partial [Chitinophagaceae bacterium]|nr:hypothetical protein [Chitinophagaceae bacterium]
GSTIDFGFRANSFGLDNSAATLDADLAAFTGAGGLATASFVQRTGDADGAAGSRIGVVRELGYVQ